MENKVSIIVPCYNHSQFLKECIASIEKQTYTHWECIIVNDGSTDETELVAQSLSNEKIQYVFQENKGLPGARNTGIRNATGEFILPLDADDTLNPEALDKMVSAFQKNPDTLIVYSDTTAFGENTKPSALQNHFELKDLLLGNKLFCTSMFRKKHFDHGIEYDESMRRGSEDWEFWINLFSKNRAMTVKKIDYQVFNYRSHPAGVSMFNTQNKKKEIREANYDFIYEKHKKLYREFYPSYIAILSRKTFLEKKLENIYTSKWYKLYNKIAKIFK